MICGEKGYKLFVESRMKENCRRRVDGTGEFSIQPMVADF